MCGLSCSAFNGHKTKVHDVAVEIINFELDRLVSFQDGGVDVQNQFIGMGQVWGSAPSLNSQNLNWWINISSSNIFLLLEVNMK